MPSPSHMITTAECRSYDRYSSSDETFHEDSVSLLSIKDTVATQTFGTVYSAVLVFLTQTLAMRCNFRPNQTLTAIHDSISAWVGLGSALVTLWNQVAVPASVFGTLNIVGYLSCISILHISIPAILSVEVFNTTVAVPAGTLGIPEYVNTSVINTTRGYMATFATDPLIFRGLFDDSQMVGLLNGSLYEVLVTTTPKKAQISSANFGNATGFDVVVDGLPGQFSASDTSLLPNALSMYSQAQYYQAGSNNSIYLSTTNMVIDSEGRQGSPLVFDHQPPAIFKDLTHLNLRSSQIQFLRCSKALVPQSATIEATSNIVIDGNLYPSIYKNHSTWVPAAELNFTSQDSTLVGGDLWADILIDSFGTGVNFVDEYLMSDLGLDPFANATSTVLKLHDIENTIANMLAMVFWSATRIKANPWYIKYSILATGSISADNGLESGAVPELATGTTTIMQETSRVRLNSNIVAVAFGLATAIIQMSFSIAFLCTPIEHGKSVEGSGMLHNIWAWRNHHQFSKSLKYVQEPTEVNLRTIGLQSTKTTDQKHHLDQCLEKTVLVDELQPKVRETLPGVKHAKIGIALHVVLVGLFVTTFAVAGARKEHSVVVPITNQQTVSFLCKLATTTFGMIYYNLLVYMTQKLAITSAIQQYSFLTTTHDKVLAWTGIGSAILTLWRQVKLPGSLFKILHISLYLATISVLHVATPALVSVESFELSILTTANTQGVTEWSNTTDNSTLDSLALGGSFLPWVNDLDPALTLGLSNGSLYDVLETAYLSSSPAEISAVGFNITCGYIPHLTVKEIQPTYYDISFPADDFVLELRIIPGNILILNSNLLGGLPADSMKTNADSVILFTQNPVYDSDGNLGSPVTIPLSNLTMQFLQCSNTLVAQTGQVDTGSRSIIPNSLYPAIKKSSSKWRPYTSVSAAGKQDESSLLEGKYWAEILTAFSSPDLLFVYGVSVDDGSMNLMQQLGLNPGGGHANMTTLAKEVVTDNSSERLSTPILATGTVEQVVLAARLDISLAATATALGASILLLILVSMFAAATPIHNSSLTSLGFLQTIWVFEHHPELSEILEEVEDPSDYNLRAAGLVKVRLSDALHSEEYDQCCSTDETEL
ncbi:hypothetical protein MSAN_00235300 [Mycena sanguinolenta]|uniref:Uncharacterized protein n=1 Tax=Mycena sanguinolenta TaxID=230812 RepID=A0A8H6ZKL0_9AGAR|nr:hypothetical protein MSAN_00235300 [Mycena sanguinolenta]